MFCGGGKIYIIYTGIHIFACNTISIFDVLFKVAENLKKQTSFFLLFFTKLFKLRCITVVHLEGDGQVFMREKMPDF